MRISIAEVIRRPVLLGIVLVSVFLIGVFVGSSVVPMIWRDVSIYVIGNVTENGCHGGFGVTPIRFGRVGGSSDGVYTVPCDELAMFSDTVGLRCDCRQR